MNRYGRFAIVIIAALLLVIGGVFYYLMQSSRIPDVAPIALDSEEPELIWRFLTDGPIIAEPVACDAGLLVCSAKGTFYLLDKETGVPQWSTNYSYGINVRPQVHGNRAYVAIYRGQIICVDLSDGRLLWKRTVRGSRYYRQMQIHKNSLFVQTSRGIVSLSLVDGKVIRHYPSSSLYPLAFSDSHIHIARSDEVAEGKYHGYIECRSPEGSLEWQTYIANAYLRALVYDKDILIVGGDDGVIRALNAGTGELAWSFDARGIGFQWMTEAGWLSIGHSILLLNDQVIFTVTQNDNFDALGAVISIDATNGKLKWTVETPHGPGGNLMHHQEHAFVWVNGGLFCVININDGSHRLVTLRPDHLVEVKLAPNVDGDRLYVASYDGYVRAFPISILQRTVSRLD
jgi:outer membrane protein assembly factor BamB